MPESRPEIPIFVSSTVFNLRDLRAEVKRWLSGLGFQPCLSSDDGFPDYANLKPWESCLPVLEKAALVIVIIDDKYGAANLDWPHYPDYKGCSPTHAEFRHAKTRGKRLLVFISKEAMHWYGIYRERRKAGQEVTSGWPPRTSLELLKFVEEVKTSEPIVWISQFEDVVELKRILKQRVLADIARAFLEREEYLKETIDILNQAIAQLPPEQRDALANNLRISNRDDLVKTITTQWTQLASLQERVIAAEKARDDEKEARLALADEHDELKRRLATAARDQTDRMIQDLPSASGHLGVRVGSFNVSGADLESVLGAISAPGWVGGFMRDVLADARVPCKLCGKTRKEHPVICREFVPSSGK